MLHRNGSNVVRPFRHQDYGVPSFSQRRTTRTPFYQADRTLPTGYDAQIPPHELQSNFPNFPSRNPKEAGYGMEGNANGMYSMEGMAPRQIASDYMMQQADPWNLNLLANGREGRIQSTARPPVGAERHPNPFAHQQAYSLMANSARAPPQQQQMYSNGSSPYFSHHAMAASPNHPEHMLRTGMEEFFNTGRPADAQSQMLRRIQRQQGGLRQPGYPQNKPTSWLPANRHPGMVHAGVPAPYDAAYGDPVGSFSPQRREYEMQRRAIPGQGPLPTRQRHPQDPQMAGVRPGARFNQEGAMMGHAARNGISVDKAVQAPLKDHLLPHYHALEEAEAICKEAYELHREPAVEKCIDDIRGVIKFVRSAATGSSRFAPQDCATLFAKVAKKAVVLIKQAKEIKARLDSPQSITSTANTPMDEQDETPGVTEGIYLTQHGSAAQIREALNPRLTIRPPLQTFEAREAQRHQEVIVLDDADEPGRQKGNQRQLQQKRVQAPAASTKLQPWLGNGHAITAAHQLPQQPPVAHELGRKRDLAPVEEGAVTETVMSPLAREKSRRKLNPASKERLHQAHQKEMQPPAETAVPREAEGSKHDEASVDGDGALEDEVEGLLEQLEGMDCMEHRKDNFLRDLILDDDDNWIYDRRFLETLASALPSPDEQTQLPESVSKSDPSMQPQS